MIKPLDSHASFQTTFFTSCVLKHPKRIILPRLPFLLKANFILYPRQPSFRNGRYTPTDICTVSVDPE